MNDRFFWKNHLFNSISISIFLSATDCFDYAKVSVHLPEHPGEFVTCTVAVDDAMTAAGSDSSPRCADDSYHAFDLSRRELVP